MDRQTQVSLIPGLTRYAKGTQHLCFRGWTSTLVEHCGWFIFIDHLTRVELIQSKNLLQLLSRLYICLVTRLFNRQTMEVAEGSRRLEEVVAAACWKTWGSIPWGRDSAARGWNPAELLEVSMVAVARATWNSWMLGIGTNDETVLSYYVL